VYGEQANGAEANENEEDEEQDIEAEIKKELADIRKPSTKPLFTSVKLDTQCCKQRLVCMRDWTLTYPSNILQNTRASRTRGVHREDLSGYRGWHAAAKLSLCEASNADHWY
jgi:hypothetical protein